MPRNGVQKGQERFLGYFNGLRIWYRGMPRELCNLRGEGFRGLLAWQILEFKGILGGTFEGLRRGMLRLLVSEI